MFKIKITVNVVLFTLTPCVSNKILALSEYNLYTLYEVPLKIGAYSHSIIKQMKMEYAEKSDVNPIADLTGACPPPCNFATYFFLFRR